MKTKLLLVVVAALLLTQRAYKPPRWPHKPKTLAVAVPPMVQGPVIAAHAIRWRLLQRAAM